VRSWLLSNDALGEWLSRVTWLQQQVLHPNLNPRIVPAALHGRLAAFGGRPGVPTSAARGPRAPRPLPQQAQDPGPEQCAPRRPAMDLQSMFAAFCMRSDRRYSTYALRSGTAAQQAQ